jgi:hypothetical protein
MDPLDSCNLKNVILESSNNILSCIVLIHESNLVFQYSISAILEFIYYCIKIIITQRRGGLCMLNPSFMSSIRSERNVVKIELLT